MRPSLLSGALLTALFATSALAQPAPPPGGGAPRPPGAEGGTPAPLPGGPAGPHDQAPPPHPGGPRRDGPPPPAPPKGAHFSLEDRNFSIEVKCADGEPMRPCADITLQFLDRMMGPAAQRPAPGAPVPR